MAAFSTNSLMQSLVKQNDFSALVTKSPILGSVDRHASGGGGGYHHSHSSHSSKGGKFGKNVAISALTLLSFLVFLNLLQSCLDQQMDNMYMAPQIIIMQARLKAAREAAERRKGETQIDAGTSTSTPDEDDKEFRTNTHTTSKPKTKFQEVKPSQKLTQIPIKLKTVEKYIYH